MTVRIREITGIAAALADLHISRGTWTPEIDRHIREVCVNVSNRSGHITAPWVCDEEVWSEYHKACAILAKHATKETERAPRHHTVLDPIVIYAVVTDVSRGAQDDFDSHAGRLISIMRRSSRHSEMGELAPWYEGRIATAAELGIPLPDMVERDGVTWVRHGDGYVREDLANERDTTRGLVRLGARSMFSFAVGLDDLIHIWRERRPGTTAHAEVQQILGDIRRELAEWQPWISELLVEVEQ